MNILFVDNHVLVLNKPAGILTQPSGTDQPSLEAEAKAWIKQEFSKPGNVFLEAVHRLDKQVSGVVLFARTSKALSRLNESMRSKLTRKEYHALIEIPFSPSEGTLEHYLVHDEHHAQVVGKEQGKLARLHYKMLPSEGKYALVEIELETGRYHQIRVQLAHSGHPVIGDQRYGSKVPFHRDQIALHARRLTFPHPISGELLSFEAPYPIDFLLK
jgi:23S rRNA pseudouridine1911/1915/1917 synthase